MGKLVVDKKIFLWYNKFVVERHSTKERKEKMEKRRMIMVNTWGTRLEDVGSLAFFDNGEAFDLFELVAHLISSKAKNEEIEMRDIDLSCSGIEFEEIEALKEFETATDWADCFLENPTKEKEKEIFEAMWKELLKE